MKKLEPFDALSLAAMGLTAAVTLGVYERLPAKLATHFDAHGVADGFMPKNAGAFVLLGIALVTWAGLRLAPNALPGAWRSRLKQSPMALVAFLVTALLLVGQLHIVSIGLDLPVTPNSIGVICGLFWLVFSLVLPRLRRNPLVGIRTPWTLASDELWARTHRFGSYTIGIGAVVAIFASLAGSLFWGLGAIVASALLPAVYSFAIRHESVGR